MHPTGYPHGTLLGHLFRVALLIVAGAGPAAAAAPAPDSAAALRVQGVVFEDGGRTARWCPGDAVLPVEFDLTDHLAPGRHTVRFVVEDMPPGTRRGTSATGGSRRSSWGGAGHRPSGATTDSPETRGPARSSGRSRKKGFTTDPASPILRAE